MILQLCLTMLKKMNEAGRLRTIDNLLKLRCQLDSEIPPKTVTDTLLFATWNLHCFPPFYWGKFIINP